MKRTAVFSGCGGVKVSVVIWSIISGSMFFCLRAQQLEPEEFFLKRKELVLPILKKFKKWLDKKALQVPPSTLMGKAVNYTLKEWDKLLRYLDSPYLTPDTNLVLCSGYYNPKDSGKSFEERANHVVAA